MLELGGSSQVTRVNTDIQEAHQELKEYQEHQEHQEHKELMAMQASPTKEDPILRYFMLKNFKNLATADGKFLTLFNQVQLRLGTH
jgi:hypothetical protein